MTLASGTAVAGDPVAEFTVGGKKHQVVILAHASGHLQDSLPTYYFTRPFTAGALNQITIDLFNASGSGVILRVKKLFLFHDQSVIVGVPHVFNIHRTSAVGTGGTAITGVKVDTANANLPAQVTARYNATGGATSGDLLFPIATNPEETLPAASLHPMINWIPEGPNLQEPILREGQGIKITQVTSSTVGVWTAQLVVTVE